MSLTNTEQVTEQLGGMALNEEKGIFFNCP
jgi:hypothetical protein